VVTQEGVQVDDSKILAIKQWPMPTSVKKLTAFLGLASYYHRFIRGFHLLAAPLTDLLKKDAFRWSDQTEVAFVNFEICIDLCTCAGFTKFCTTICIGH